jgi:hypothetical protein
MYPHLLRPEYTAIFQWMDSIILIFALPEFVPLFSTTTFRKSPVAAARNWSFPIH